MRILEVRPGEIAILVDPGDCLMLAEACRAAADESFEKFEKGDPPEARMLNNTYYITGTLFDSLALLASTTTAVMTEDVEVFTFDDLQAAWSFLPKAEWTPRPKVREVAK